MPYPRVCEECGNEFVPDYKDHTYCSSECAKGEPNMNTAKHTPGPWNVVYHSYGYEIKSVHVSHTQTTLYPVVTIKPQGDREIANAHLIAAAPAMYEALRQSLVLVELAALEEWGRAVRGEQQPPTTEARDREKFVKQALAQAEGK